MALETFRQRVRDGIIRNYTASAQFDGDGPVESLAESEENKWLLDNYDGTHVVGRVFWKMFGVKYGEGV